MPLAKIHVVEGRYDEARIAKMSGAVQAALMNTLGVPAGAPDNVAACADLVMLTRPELDPLRAISSEWRRRGASGSEAAPRDANIASEMSQLFPRTMTG